MRVCDPSLLVKITEDLLGRTVSAGNRAMNGTIVSGYVGSFSGKEQSVFDGACQSLLCTVGVYATVAVRTTRKRIVLPIVKVGIGEQLCEFLQTNSEQTAQCLQTSIDNKRATLADNCSAQRKGAHPVIIGNF